MRTQQFLIGLVGLALFVTEVAAADLSRVNRTIVREPAYRSKPKYCLLVFGPKAKTRVWLVQDGDTLYVDRNGNGDLTEPGKKITAEKGSAAADGEYVFQVGDLRDGIRLHKRLSVSVSKVSHLGDYDANVKALLASDPKALRHSVSIEVDMPEWKGAGVGGRITQRAIGVDASGVLQFADQARLAPIIHFVGPRQITLFSRPELVIGREQDVVLAVGTPGIGPGTTAFLDYEGVIPEKAYPTLEITYPSRQKGEAPVRKRYVLKRRC